jgi:hypothetical protein
LGLEGGNYIVIDDPRLNIGSSAKRAVPLVSCLAIKK